MQGDLVSNWFKNDFNIHSNLNLVGIAVNYISRHSDSFRKVYPCEYDRKIVMKYRFNTFIGYREGINRSFATRFSPAQVG